MASSSEALFDKVMNTALAIISRLKIHQYLNYRLDCQCLDISNKILQTDCLYNPRDNSLEQLKTTLTAQLMSIEQRKLDEKLTCWRDLLEPMRYFLALFFQHKESEQDRKLLEEK